MEFSCPHKTEEWKWFDWDNLPENLFLPLKQLKMGKFYGKPRDYSHACPIGFGMLIFALNKRKRHIHG